ncbi:MAG: winged helix-turn-helix domain-containing protein [Chloroflexota bacterium]
MRITAIIAIAVSWLAPVPSAYFVAVSSMQHLAAPLPMAIIIAVVLEGLGLSCSHLALAFWNHNIHTHRLAQYRVAWVEFYLSLAMYVTYFVTTLALLAMLELAWVTLLFPVLAAVGVVNLALREQLAQLRTPVKRVAQPIVQKSNKGNKSETPDVGNELDNAILSYYVEHRHATMRQVASEVGCVVSTVNKHVKKLETQGHIERNGNGVTVCNNSELVV